MATKQVKFNPIVSESKSRKRENINKCRTKLLVHIDLDNQKYLKSCQTSINDKLPREAMKAYSDYIITIEDQNFNNSTKDVVNKGVKVNIVLDENIRDSKESFLFSKGMNELGRDFIDLRKKNVSHKKLDKVRPSCIDTELSYIEAQMKSSKRKSDVAFKFPNLKRNIEEFFLTKEEKQAKSIQSNFNKLHSLVNAVKINKKMSQKYDNFTKFNEQLFDILEFKGIKLDPKWEDKNIEKSNREASKHPKLKSCIPVNPFKAGPISEEISVNVNKKESKWKSIGNFGTNPDFRGKDRAMRIKSNAGFDYSEYLETNFNTNGNASPCKHFRIPHYDDHDDSMALENNSEITFLSSPDNNLHTPHYHARMNSTSDNGIENRVSNISANDYDNGRLSNISNFDVDARKSDLGKDAINLRYCVSPSIIDDTGSRNSRLSIMSQNNSVITRSSVASEVSNEFDFNEKNV